MSDKKKMGDTAALDDYPPFELSVDSQNYPNAPRPKLGGVLSIPLDSGGAVEARGSYMQQPYEPPSWKAMLGYKRRF